MSGLLSLSKIPTVSQLYKCGKLLPSPSKNLLAADADLNSIVSTVQFDITELGVDAIVNAANRTLLGGGGVDYVIHRAAGRQLLEECRTLGGCDTGSAKITDAYHLAPIRKVIHAVGPIYDDYRRSRAEELLRGCYKTSLELALENGCKSIAFSCISTGIYGYPSSKAAEAVCSEVRNFLEKRKGGSTLEKVVFCCFLDKDVDAYEVAIPKYFPPTDSDMLPPESEPASTPSQPEDPKPRVETATQPDSAPSPIPSATEPSTKTPADSTYILPDKPPSVFSEATDSNYERDATAGMSVSMQVSIHNDGDWEEVGQDARAGDDDGKANVQAGGDEMSKLEEGYETVEKPSERVVVLEDDSLGPAKGESEKRNPHNRLGDDW